MAISIDYQTFEILIPKADTTFVQNDPVTGLEIRSLDMDDFWKALADIQDNEDDVWASTAFVNTPPQDLGDITLARSVIILEPFFVTLEDGNYSVNLIGGNTNIRSRLTVNSVSVNPSNTIGYVQGEGGNVYQSCTLDIEIENKQFTVDIGEHNRHLSIEKQIDVAMEIWRRDVLIEKELTVDL